MYPAAHEHAIAVTAVTAQRERPAFASYGAWVDIAAPGNEIFSAFPVNAYAFWSGTSMATPFVAGQAAQQRSLMPSLTAAQVEGCILNTAQTLTPELGAGLIDMAASLNAAATGCEDDEESPDDDDDDDTDQDSAGFVIVAEVFLPIVIQR
jgi:subtilisin family serine protease